MCTWRPFIRQGNTLSFVDCSGNSILPNKNALMKIQISIFAIALLAISCATVKLQTPAASDIDRVKSSHPDYTLAEVNEGKTLYEQKCVACHGLKNPASETAAEWNHIVPEMVQKASRKGISIDSKQQELILKYLITMSKK